MKLNLALPIVSNDIASVLKAVYAFAPTYQFAYNADNSTLETVIDASHDLTSDQWTIVAGAKYTVTFVLPDSATPPVAPVALVPAA